MGFVVLETTNKEKYCIAKELIGHYSVTSHKCEVCGMEHSVLDIYDRRGCLICSLKDTKDKIEQLCSEIEKGNGNPGNGNLGNGNPEDGNPEDGDQEDVKPANNKEVETKADDVKKNQQDRKDN